MGMLERSSHESKIQLSLFSQIFFWPNQGKILLIHQELAQPHLIPLQWMYCITLDTTGQNCLVISNPYHTLSITTFTIYKFIWLANFIAGHIAKLLRRLGNYWDFTSIVRIFSLKTKPLIFRPAWNGSVSWRNLGKGQLNKKSKRGKQVENIYF